MVGTVTMRAWRAAVLSLLVVVALVVLVAHQGSTDAAKSGFAAVRDRTQLLLDSSVFDTPLFPEFQDASGATTSEAPLPQAVPEQISVDIITAAPVADLVTQGAAAAAPQQISVQMVGPNGQLEGSEPVQIAGASAEGNVIHIELQTEAPAVGVLTGMEPRDLPIVDDVTSDSHLEPVTAVPTLPVEHADAMVDQVHTFPPFKPVAYNQPERVVITSQELTPTPTVDPEVAHFKLEEAHWKKQEQHWKEFEAHMKVHKTHMKKIEEHHGISGSSSSACKECDELHNQLKDLKSEYTQNQHKISQQSDLMQKAHFIQRLQNLERAVAQQQVHIMWQKKQLDQINTLESVIPQLVHGTKPLWGPGSEISAASMAADGGAVEGLTDRKISIDHRLSKVEKVLNAIMAKNGHVGMVNHAGELVSPKN